MIKSTKLIRNLSFFLGGILSLIWLYPFILIFINSIKTKGEIFSNTLFWPENLTIENYPAAFEDLDYVKSFLNSFMITAVSVLLIVVFTSMAAYALSRNKRKSSSVIYFLCALTMLIPFHSIMIPLVELFGKINLLNPE